MEDDRADPSKYRCGEDRTKLVQMWDRGAMLDLGSQTSATILCVTWGNLLLDTTDVVGNREEFVNCVFFFKICLCESRVV